MFVANISDGICLYVSSLEVLIPSPLLILALLLILAGDRIPPDGWLNEASRFGADRFNDHSTNPTERKIQHDHDWKKTIAYLELIQAAEQLDGKAPAQLTFFRMMQPRAKHGNR